MCFTGASRLASPFHLKAQAVANSQIPMPARAVVDFVGLPVSPGATLAGGRARMTGPDCGSTGH